MVIRHLRALAVLTAAAIACSPAAPVASPTLSIGKMQELATFTAAGNDFGFRLLDELLGSAGDNVLVSPLSASLALSMADEGARGETRTAIEQTLGVQGQAREVATELLSSLSEPGDGVQLAIGNSAWVREGFQLRQEYIDTLAAAYRAQAASLDFSSPAAAGRINAWVNEHTRGLIPTIIDRIPGDVVLYLINALYFQADWSTPFDRTLTRPKAFHTARGGGVQVPMMSRTDRFSYTELDGVQAVALPYRGGRFRMIVALPAATKPASQFRTFVTPAWWQQLESRLSSQRGTVSLPRFTLDWGAELAPSLQALGMGPALGPGADLSGISERCGCSISSVLQKTHIEVDERGTKAAAATAVATAVSFTRPVDPFTMVVDHPFLLGLTDQTTGAVLFLGVIGNPRSS